MNELTREIYDYLLQAEENAAADFLLNACSLENRYVDIAFEIHDEGETDLHDVEVGVLPKFYRSLQQYSQITEAIETAINEHASAHHVHIRNLQWFPYMKNTVHISDKTIDFLGNIITGDSAKTPYQSGPKLVDFFNAFGLEDKYGQGFPSRWLYAEQKLKELNKNGRIKNVIERYFDPVNFIGKNSLLDDLISELNEYLAFDNLSLNIIGKKATLAPPQTTVSTNRLRKIDHDFIEENIVKCDQKIIVGGYSGAITNARPLVESVLIYIDSEMTGREERFNGDLNALYKKVAKELGLSVEKDAKIDEALKKLISGMFSIVSGIAELGNDLGDRHGRLRKTYRVDKHHATLIVNAAKSFSEFVFCSFESQHKE